MRWAALIAWTLTGLALGAAPSAAALPPPPTVVTFEPVPLGTVLPFTVGGVRFSVQPAQAPANCHGSVIPDPELSGRKLLEATCDEAVPPVLRAEFGQIQWWASWKVTAATVPATARAFYPDGVTAANSGSQGSPAPTPFRDGFWSPPVTVNAQAPRMKFVQLEHWHFEHAVFQVRALAFSQADRPQLEITAAPPDLTGSTAASIAFATSDTGPVFRCSLDGKPPEGEPCTASYAKSGLADGSHYLGVYLAGDDYDGTTGWKYAYFTVDTLPPETSVTLSGAGSPYAENAVRISPYANETVTYQCALDGGPFGPCPPNNVYSGLPPGVHTVRVRAIDRAGNADPSPAEAAFNVRAARAASIFDPAGPPEAGRSSTVKPLDGKVFVRVHGRFHRLDRAANVPVGAVVDARKGRLAVTTAADFRPASDPRHHTSSAQLSAGIFAIRQARAAAGAARTDIRLRTPPGKTRACAARRLPRKGVVRSLTGAVKGTYRAVGAVATVTVRNARWSVEDTCGGTRVRARSGKVAVAAKGGKRPVQVSPGHSLLIRARLFAARRRH